MKKGFKILALLTAAALIAGLSGCKPPKRALSEEEKSRIETRFQDMMDERGFSGAVYAVYRGEVVFDGGRGQATDTLQNSSETAYGMASLTKQFTAAAVMQLFEQGKLDIDDRLSQYFPDYRYGENIRLKHLLSQRSGIPDYEVDSREDMVIVGCYGAQKALVIDMKKTAEENIVKIREYFLSQELLFEPGERYDYSDSNYALLAEIIAQVSGMSYHEYVRQHIFEPLGMEHSAFIDDYDPEQMTAVAETDREEFSEDYYAVKGVEYGCGDILTTPQDMYRWYRGLTGGEVVGEAAYKQMTTNFSRPEEGGYGYGLMISDKGESKAVYHYGFIPSYYSAVVYIPEYDYFEAVSGNHADGNPHRLASDMAQYFASVIGLKLGDLV